MYDGEYICVKCKPQEFPQGEANEFSSINASECIYTPLLYLCIFICVSLFVYLYLCIFFVYSFFVSLFLYSYLIFCGSYFDKKSTFGSQLKLPSGNLGQSAIPL